MSQAEIFEKIKLIPVAYQQEVEDFIDFILQKKNIDSPDKNKRKIGLLKDKMKMSTDFDEPLKDFKNYME
ncbi:type II toxin-antitoxin system VapB family antitoxin [Pedobacter mendelii]|uniref:DUF2281 domain-containing protein n=1 Tax=Pedobacter mendelii TaxID=1908240 RepID=A0ABQ2BDY3_9SPHI|nr:DUF2281 domain-containing protein [Pedobacter mendelii]GGI22609.1 hypothetical protein GCM10008119_03500 [Pedobacter mendelii]